jgi:hypothetical protein
VSWAQQLADELTARGVLGRERRRIVLELQDHIACEPGCQERLGDPEELAACFADELATDSARRGAFGAFGALVLAALALAVSQLAIAPAGGYPGFDHGHSLVLFAAALLGMFIAPQAALIAGTLAAWRTLRRRHSVVLPAAEIALIRRRSWVGLGAGTATMVGLELYVLDFSAVLPDWWLALVGALAGFALVALLAVAARLRRAGALVASREGLAGDVFDDLPLLSLRWLRGNPWRLGAASSLAVGLAATLFEWHAEHSLFEGLQRGACEGLAAAVGFALLGRAIGVASAVREPAVETEWAAS